MIHEFFEKNFNLKNNISFIFIAVFLSGASALILEVVSSKFLFYFFSVNTYSFSTVLSAFLLGLGLGSFITGKIISKIKNKKLFFAFLQLIIAFYAVIFLTQYNSIPVILSFLYSSAGSFESRLLVKFLLSMFYLLPATVFLGATLPLSSALLIKEKQKAGETVAFIYSADLAGSIIGSFIAGFYFIPVFGLTKTIIFSAFLNVFAVVFLISGRKLKENKVFLAVILLFLFSSLIVSFNENNSFFVLNEFQEKQQSFNPANFNDSNSSYSSADVNLADVNNNNFYMDSNSKAYSNDLSKEFFSKVKVFFKKDSAFGEISVGFNKDVGKALFIDRRLQCSNKENQSEKAIAVLSLTNSVENSRVLNVGLGCGYTLSSVLNQKNTGKVKIVEINPVIVEAHKKFFAEDLNYPLDKNKTILQVIDAAEFLLTSNEKFDSIIVDVENPAVIHSSILYTIEYFKLFARHLNKKGIFSLWAYTGSVEYLDIIYSSLKKSFNYVIIKENNGYYLFFASNHPLSYSDFKLNEHEKQILNELQNNDLTEVNSLDKPTLEKFFIK